MPPEKKEETQFNDVKKIIAPAGVQVFSNYLKIGDKFAKTFFVFRILAISRQAGSSP